MAGSTENPRIWVNADVYTAPYQTAAPTSPTSSLNAAFEALGLLSEDGMTEAQENETSDHYAWGGVLVRTTRSKHKRTFVVTALEDNAIVFNLVNPGSPTFNSGGVTTRTVKVPQPNPRAFVIDRHDGTTDSRIYIPRGEVTDVGDITSSDSEMSMYELTITVYPSSDGTLYREFTDADAANDLVS